MTDNRKLPPRRANDVPSEREDEARLPAPPGTNGGIIKHGFSRLWAWLGRGTTDENTELVRSQTQYVQAYGQLADTAYETKRKVDRLRHDLPSQLDVDRAQHADAMEAAQHQIARNKAKRDAELTDDERVRIERDLNFKAEQADKRRILHHAIKKEADAKVKRDIRERTGDMQVDREVTAFQTGDFAELDKFMRAKASYEKMWGDENQTQPDNTLTELEQELAILKKLLADAQAENAPAEHRVALHEKIDDLSLQIEAEKAKDKIP